MLRLCMMYFTSDCYRSSVALCFCRTVAALVAVCVLLSVSAIITLNRSWVRRQPTTGTTGTVSMSADGEQETVVVIGNG